MADNIARALAAKSADTLQSAQSHNGFFRGKNLTNIYSIEQLHEKVSKGDFSDLYLGDYITVSITTTLPNDESGEGETKVVTENVDLMIAAFDYYWNCGDAPTLKHHIVLIPRTYFQTPAKMNQTNTTEGGYLNSYMHQTVLPCYASSLKTALNNHLLSYKTILSSNVNAATPSMAGAGLSGASITREWTTVELQLMNEIQIYGSMVWSSSAYEVGIDNRKFPVFNFISSVQYGRGSFALRSVASATYFAYCNDSGNSNARDASATLLVRPFMLFG